MQRPELEEPQFSAEVKAGHFSAFSVLPGVAVSLRF